ncbi:MAG: hypothetical protein GY866_26185, partial [Proteobacteria bacterium]|nr:hypothetical protein [Pseudomonadota bacterium]
ITHIFVTHGDPDHYEHAASMAQETGASVFCGDELVNDFNSDTTVHAVRVSETVSQSGLTVQGLKATHGPLSVKLGGGLLEMKNEVCESTQGGQEIFFGPFRAAKIEQEMQVRNHGTIKLLFGLIRLEKDNVPFARGSVGFKIDVGGKSIVNLGDSLLKKEWAGLMPDTLMIPIGGDVTPNTMGVNDAIEAVKLIQPKMVIPMHYNAPFLWRKNVNPADDSLFQTEVEKLGIECHIMSYGDQIEID